MLVNIINSKEAIQSMKKRNCIILKLYWFKLYFVDYKQHFERRHNHFRLIYQKTKKDLLTTASLWPVRSNLYYFLVWPHLRINNWQMMSPWKSALNYFLFYCNPATVSAVPIQRYSKAIMKSLFWWCFAWQRDRLLSALDI